MSEQTIFKAHRTERERWTSVLNETIRDPSLTFRATGLLIYLLSLPPDWKANQQHIATCKKEGRDAMVTAWNELRKAGYVHKEVIRSKGKIITTIWHIFERAQEPDSRLTEKPETAEPETAEPETAEPISENPTLRRTKRNEGLKETKGASAGVAEAVPIPESLRTPEFESAWAMWRSYRREARLKPYCATSAKTQLAKLEKVGPKIAADAINNSIAQQWHGIHIPHGNQRQDPAQSIPHIPSLRDLGYVRS